MPPSRLVLAVLSAGALLVAAAVAAAPPTEIQVWTGLTGQSGDLLARFAQDFNKTHADYRVVVSFKGQYPEQHAAAVAAYRAGNPPHIMQMFDAGTGDMMGSRNVIVPVSEVFKRAGLAFDPAAFIAPARSYYGMPDGSLLSMPFNVSTAVLYYNKDVLHRAGLDPGKPPRTWPELIDAARKVRAQNAAGCGFTTAWPAWIMLEQYSSRHNLALGTRDNGRAGFDATLMLATPLQIRMLQTLLDMQKDKSFDYGGRSDDAVAKFTSGGCAMLTTTSGSLGEIQRDAKFQLGVAQLPYWPDVPGAPYATTIGGASLWAFNAPRRSEAEFRGVALFLDYLRTDRIMAEWARTTGYLPATGGAFKLLQDEGFYRKNPGRDVPVLSLLQGRSGANTNGYRFGRWTEIRDIYQDELEKALQGRQGAADALRNTERRGNALLRAFERTAH